MRRHKRTPRARAPRRRGRNRHAAPTGAGRRHLVDYRARAMEPGADGLRRAGLRRPSEVRRVRGIGVVRIAGALRRWRVTSGGTARHLWGVEAQA